MWGEIDVPTLKTKIKFNTYFSKHRDEVMEVLRKSFFKFETVCIGSEIDLVEEAQRDLEKLCEDALEKSNLSFLAFDVEKNKIVGVAINVIQTKPSSRDEGTYFETFRDNCRTENAKSLMNFMIEADSRVNMFEKYDVSMLMEIMFLGVLPEYGRHGIGYELCKYSVELAKQLDLKLVTSLFTSRGSQKIGKKLGFNVITEESFDNFTFNEKSFAERNGDKTLVYHLVAKSINESKSGSAEMGNHL